MMWLLKIFLLAVVAVATLQAVVGAVMLIIAVYDMLIGQRWGYPWWSVPVSMVVAAFALLVRRAGLSGLKKLKNG